MRAPGSRVVDTGHAEPPIGPEPGAGGFECRMVVVMVRVGPHFFVSGRAWQRVRRALAAAGALAVSGLLVTAC